MLYNFSYEGLIESISCDKICFEGHEVENLISRSYLKRSKGFLCMQFIKPPVDVRLEFNPSINISYIIIGCCVGSQKSQVIHISAERKYGLSNVAKFIRLQNDERGIVIHKNGVVGQESFIRDAQVKKYKFVPCLDSRCLLSVKSVVVTVFACEKPSVPALSQLDVWGSLHKHIPQEKAQKVDQLWKSIMSPPRPPVKVDKTNETRPKNICYLRKRKIPLEIPEEFVDPITREIMKIPVVLPSGKIIDSSTLERFCAEEARWGRNRSDPFTGVVFTENRQPVFATALKIQIDKFLLDHCEDEEVKELPRVVGIPETSKKAKTEISSLLNPGTDSTNSSSSSSSSFSSASSSSSLPKVPKLSASRIAPSTVDSLIDDSLAGLPSFTAPAPPVAPSASTQCCKCSSNIILFRLPCSHIVCRQCLSQSTSQNTSYCFSCKTRYKSSDPVRCHVSFTI